MKKDTFGCDYQWYKKSAASLPGNRSGRLKKNWAVQKMQLKKNSKKKYWLIYWTSLDCMTKAGRYILNWQIFHPQC